MTDADGSSSEERHARRSSRNDVAHVLLPPQSTAMTRLEAGEDLLGTLAGDAMEPAMLESSGRSIVVTPSRVGLVHIR